MKQHKFDVGQVVRAGLADSGAVPPGSYKVVSQLPSEDNQRNNQYRVKSISDGHERILRETDLL